MAEIKLWPLMGLAAIRSNLGGGWRLYSIAKSLDLTGRGWVYREDLTAYILSLGVSKKTLRRWLTEARNNDLVSDTQSRSGQWRLILAGHYQAAAAVGCESVGNRRVEVSAQELVSKGWRAVIWAAYQATHKGRPISRAKMQDITGVPVSTQYAYQVRSGLITSKPNYAVSDIPAENLGAMKEFTDRAAPFKVYQKDNRRWVCAWRVPDSRDVALCVRGGGRSSKINKSLRSVGGLCQEQRALSQHSVRMFNLNQAQLKTTDRQLASRDNQPDDLYQLRAERPDCTIWDHVPYAI